MWLIKRKKYRTKKHHQSTMNYLISFGLVVLMVLMSLPKMALAQVIAGASQLVLGITNANIKLPNAEYTESTIDLRVKVLGGEVKINRTWVNGRWYANPKWADLRFVADPLGVTSIKTIGRAGTLYERTGDANLYSAGQVHIKKTDTGWQWYDRKGNWINYDAAGRLIKYGDRNNVTVTFERDNEGRLLAIKDHHGELVYSFTYDADERLIKVTGTDNRIVSYTWQGNLLTKVTDVLGNDWLYSYDGNGQLSQRTEPDGGVIKLEYSVSEKAPNPAMTSGKSAGKIEQPSIFISGAQSKDFKVARVGKITDKTGAISLWNVQYNTIKKQYTVTHEDPLGKQTIQVFDKDGNRLSITINGELQETIKRDTANNIIKYTDQRGLTATVYYNQQQRPIKVIYPNGATAQIKYNNASYPISYIDQSGVETQWQYDNKGNLTKEIEAVGNSEQRITSHTYDVYGQPVSITYGEGDNAITLHYIFDDKGNIVSFTDGNGQKYSYSYNNQGKVTGITNPLNASWQTVYDKAGRLVQTTDPLDHNTYYINDAIGRTITQTDALGINTKYYYQFNNNGWQIDEIDALNNKIKYEYDLLGRLTKVILPSGLTSELKFDSFGRVINQFDSAGNQYELKYGQKNTNLDGLLTKIIYPTYVEEYQYNELGLPTIIKQSLTGDDILITQFGYDQQGREISITDSANRTTQFQYNKPGDQSKHIDALANKTTQEWDQFGNITRVIDAKGNVYRFTYDNNSNLIKETKALGNEVSYKYDAANQLIEQLDASGNKTNYEYDLAGRLIKESYIAKDQVIPSQVITYHYNAADQLIETTQTGDTKTRFNYQRDALGRTVKETITYGGDSHSITKVVHYSYDVDGNLASITYPDGSLVSYTYEKGQLKTIKQPNGETISWDHYQWLQPTQITYPNVTETLTYNKLQEPLTALVKNNNNQVLMSRTYQYDKVGNIINRGSEEGVTQYNYDLLDRLIQVEPSKLLQQKGLPVESYSYDAINNRTGSAHQAGDWIYNDKNQLIQWGDANEKKTLTYTPTGHIASETQGNKTLTYSYNTADRLTFIKNGTAEIASYQYDPYGRRISKTVKGETTYYIYTDEGLIAELNQQGNLIVAYGWEPDSDDYSVSPLWQANLGSDHSLKTAQYNYLHTDHLGTVQLATSSQGDATWKAVSEAFGKTLLDTNNKITMNLRFPGQYYDQETGTHYNYFRDYNPNIGRYIQSDPIGLGGGLNWYGYAEGNPLYYTDPTGEIIPILVGVGKAAAAAYVRCTVKCIAKTCISGIVKDALSNDSDCPKSVCAGAGDCFTECLKPWNWGGKGPKRPKNAGPTSNFKSKQTRKGGKEHTKNKRKSTQEKHEKGQSRKGQDKKGGEKGDKNRPYRR